ncbi:Nucleoside 5-triphosphatase RdgB (dHAPTP, dITP, XTP-specific) [Candidatus Burkholderia crenata]|nr:Nucleoside 5-triphosphatase RdgB (dHAPTP, dITP, XTP-specific) [Candidatus Burkholderia crenata]
MSDSDSVSALRRVVLASNNPRKLREFAALLSTAGIDLVTQGELGVSEAEEPHVTFVENALAKARHASAATGLSALTDDSGLCVHVLRGAPGLYSTRYAQLLNGGEKSDAANNAHNARLVADLANETNRRAYFFSVLVLVRHADDPEPLIAEGRWHGEVIDTPRGANGFGYDVHFLVPSLGQTAAALDPAVKNASSHRAIALRCLLARLKEVS